MLLRSLKKGIILALLPLMVACGNDDTTGTTSEDIDSLQDSGMNEAPIAHTPGAKTDPVCEMEKDDTWTEYSVVNNDTTWFCSEGCKKAFDARPEKYTGKK